MENVKVSIIVPVYNVEKYVTKCIESLINQTHKNLEIIIIDDGSTDNSLQICNKYKLLDERIIVIHKSNEGLGLTRNKGLECATGKYIYFIDSDDYLDKVAINECVEFAEKYKLDIVTFGVKYIDDDNIISKEIVPVAPKNIVDGNTIIVKEVLPIVLGYAQINDQIKNLIGTTWSSLYSRKLIEKSNWKFDSEREILSEDAFSLLKLYKDVNRLGVIERGYYYYRKNQNSLTHSYKQDKMNINNNFLERGLKICEKNGYHKNVIKGLNKYYISNAIGIIKSIYKSDMDRKEIKKEIKKIIYNDLLQATLKEYDYKNDSIFRRIFLQAIKIKSINLVLFFLMINT